MQALDAIIALTGTVEAHVERGEWAEAGALDAERCRLLGELFADPEAAAELDRHRHIIEDLLVRNQRTLERVRGCQEQLTRASAALTHARGAMQAYGRAAGNLIYLHQPRTADP
jgi:hypothetical protein